MSSEATIQRRLTTQYISTRPIEVVLTPYTATRTQSGGTTWVAGAARAAQTMRFIEASDAPMPLQTVDGKSDQTVFELMAEWDALLETNDRFTYADQAWRVTSVYPDNGYERRAKVTRHGG